MAINYYKLKIVDRLDGEFHGNAKGPIIRILKGCENDKGLLEHEKVHVKQWWKGGLFIHSLRYKYSDKYRYKCEIQAYKKQMQYSYHPKIFAKFITERYKLDVKYEKVLKDLGKEL